MPAAEYACACMHLLSLHDRPTGSREPWGKCNALLQDDSGQIVRCDCREAWPMEEDEE